MASDGKGFTDLSSVAVEGNSDDTDPGKSYDVGMDSVAGEYIHPPGIDNIKEGGDLETPTETYDATYEEIGLSRMQFMKPVSFEEEDKKNSQEENIHVYETLRPRTSRKTMKVCDRLRSKIVEASARSGCSLIVHSVCIDFSYRWLACVPFYLAIS